MASREPDNMLSKTLVERYKIQRQLGRKAGRRTLLARDLKTQELVVVKLLIFSDEFEWQDLKLFEREAQALQMLSHPAIPRYLDYFELDLPHAKGFALVQTHIDALSLEEHVKTGRTFTSTELQQLAQGVLKVLSYLHQQHPPIIHRDLKPSNILLTNRSGNRVGEIYLVDFGSIQTVVGRGSTMTVVGTYGYMPPEQFGGRATPASDLYSLGATLIYLATGTHPADLTEDGLHIEFNQAVNLSPQFVNWLKWLTQASLKKRPASARAALQGLSTSNIVPTSSATIRQPTGSKVKLTKNPQFIEILIPPAGFSLGIGFMAIFAMVWLGFLVVWTGGAVLSGGWWFALFSIVHWSVGLALVWTILFSLFGRVRLRIDSNRVCLSHELFGMKRVRTGLRQDISKLIQTEPYYKQVKGKNGTRHVLVNPGIGLWVGTQKYEIGGNSGDSWFSASNMGVSTGGLSDPELDWLASELSDWIEMPINK
jgi:serine/threonine protein kinase